MSEQLDRIEALLTAMGERLESVRLELKQDISGIKSDVARVDGRLDGIDRQLDGEVQQITSMVLNLGDQIQRAETSLEDFKREIRNLITDMQHMRGIFQAHIEHTDRILNYLMRRMGPDNAA